MRNPFLAIARTGIQTLKHRFPDLPAEATGLPTVTALPCQECGRCAASCPTRAITVHDGAVTHIGCGQCIGCQQCIRCCAAGTLAEDRTTYTAVRTRDALICSNRPYPRLTPAVLPVFRRSLHVREVSTGDNASDLEVIAGHQRPI